MRSRSTALRLGVLLPVLALAFASRGDGCSCNFAERVCESLRGDLVFVGTVLETTPVAQDGPLPVGYTMRFRVEEVLVGPARAEAVVETGGGFGDCGTPLPEEERFLIFAYRTKEGPFRTGLCSGNLRLSSDADEKIVDEVREFVRSGVSSVFGTVESVKPVWIEGDIEDSSPKPARGIVVRAISPELTRETRSAVDGSFELSGLAPGEYTVTPEPWAGWDFDHERNHQVVLAAGQCRRLEFRMEPATRIRGRVILPPDSDLKTVEVAAIPTSLRTLNQFSGQWDFTDENGRFDLWPLPPGDYYVGVNITSSPSARLPFVPTYYPGVTNQRDARIVHMKEGDVKELELPLSEVAKERLVRFVATGLDGKPLRKIYVQLEDLRHPYDAFAYMNVDLDEQGAGELLIYAGYSYHLHGSLFVAPKGYWCAKPVAVAAADEPVDIRFVMDRKGDYCHIEELDREGAQAARP